MAYTRTISPVVIGNFVVILPVSLVKRDFDEALRSFAYPNRNERINLMSQSQILITPVLRKSRPVIIQGHNLLGRYHGPLIFTRNTDLILIDVVTQMDHVIDAIFASSIAICVEIAQWIICA